MTLEQFRLIHSELIENYQYVEMHLEGIYAALSDKSFCDGLGDVLKTNLHRLLSIISKMDNNVFSDAEIKRLNCLFERRNFWIHNCYTDLVFEIKDGGPKKESDIRKIKEDLSESLEVREWLYNKKVRMMQNRYQWDLKI